uniref:Uncharacterized protein n=1 Tax=Panagrolaimus sp. ES5 TaxID=591445 RepID=A0AC34FTK8_9BILA
MKPSLITNFFRKRNKDTPSPASGLPSNKESRTGPSPPFETPIPSTPATTSPTTTTPQADTVRQSNFALSAQPIETPVTTGRNVFSLSAYPQSSDSNGLKAPLSQYDIGLAVGSKITDEQIIEFIDNLWIPGPNYKFPLVQIQ